MRCKAQEYLIKDLLSQSILSNGTYFTRFDIIVNYLAIENYYGKNNFGWDMHYKLEKNSPKGEDAKEMFVNLIKSFEKDGSLLNQFPLTLSDINCRLHVRDGAHRFACAIYFGYDKVWAKIKNPRKLSLRHRKTSRKFAKMSDVGSHTIITKGFTQEEIEIIRNKKNEIFKKFGLLTQQTDNIVQSYLLMFFLSTQEIRELADVILETTI